MICRKLHNFWPRKWCGLVSLNSGNRHHLMFISQISGTTNAKNLRKFTKIHLLHCVTYSELDICTLFFLCFEPFNVSMHARLLSKCRCPQAAEALRRLCGCADFYKSSLDTKNLRSSRYHFIQLYCWKNTYVKINRPLPIKLPIKSGSITEP